MSYGYYTELLICNDRIGFAKVAQIVELLPNMGDTDKNKYRGRTKTSTKYEQRQLAGSILVAGRQESAIGLNISNETKTGT